MPRFEQAPALGEQRRRRGRAAAGATDGGHRRSAVRLGERPMASCPRVGHPESGWSRRSLPTSVAGASGPRRPGRRLADLELDHHVVVLVDEVVAVHHVPAGALGETGAARPGTAPRPALRSASRIAGRCGRVSSNFMITRPSRSRRRRRRPSAPARTADPRGLPLRLRILKSIRWMWTGWNQPPLLVLELPHLDVADGRGCASVWRVAALDDLLPRLAVDRPVAVLALEARSCGVIFVVARP